LVAISTKEIVEKRRLLDAKKTVYCLKECPIQYGAIHSLAGPIDVGCNLHINPDIPAKFKVVRSGQNLAVVVCNVAGAVEFVELHLPPGRVMT
jgi:hypothetical protein